MATVCYNKIMRDTLEEKAPDKIFKNFGLFHTKTQTLCGLSDAKIYIIIYETIKLSALAPWLQLVGTDVHCQGHWKLWWSWRYMYIFYLRFLGFFCKCVN